MLIEAVASANAKTIVVLETGSPATMPWIGKVNAAMTATLLLDHFRPDEILFTGVAGGINPDLAPGDIVLGEKTAQHDRGKLTTAGFSPQPTGEGIPLLMSPPERLLALAEAAAKDADLDRIKTTRGERVPRVIRGVIVTGDIFVASPAKTAELRKMFKADAVEMEGAAVAQVCWQFHVPCLVIRSISDLADNAADKDVDIFMKAAANNAAGFVKQIVTSLGSAAAAQPSAAAGS